MFVNNDALCKNMKSIITIDVKENEKSNFVNKFISIYSQVLCLLY